ncbi:MAG: aldehyde ferredoxin oxidoreductase family protein [Anaerolineaceae bacterium]|nr:aldehyde ferredoxin oxidoreductase family protein [Anaerolineaceae bacterium]
MTAGYTGKILWVDLGTGSTDVEQIPEKTLREFIGGYGLAARIYFDRMEAGVDPLGPDNILGFTTGPLTGRSAFTGTRWTVTCKSPLTGGWGDANGSGSFGIRLKEAGYDCVFIKGIAEKPVYLWIHNGAVEICDAGEVWGMDTYQLDDWTKETYGKNAESACIGPSGENLSLISAIIHAKGRAAGRSGVGAVMGSKKLKAVIVDGNLRTQPADEEAVKNVRKKFREQIERGVGFSHKYRTTGTPGGTSGYILKGDVPTKNWKESTLKSPAPELYSFDELLKFRDKKKACFGCPFGCWGTSKIEYQGEEVLTHQPEYETEGAFGPNLMNGDMQSIIAANHLCNLYGLDTISAGMVISYAFECYEHDMISKEDTGGLDLHWGDPEAILAMLEKVAAREDIGDLLADGVLVAAREIGEASKPFAIHAGGQEFPMHDPRCEPNLAVIYKLDATPGRHTQASVTFTPEGFETPNLGFGTGREDQKGRGLWVKDGYCLNHTMTATGLCMFGHLGFNIDLVPDFLSAVTGWEYSLEEMLITGERIANIRQAFNSREGINPVTQEDPWRAYGDPPLSEGVTKGVKVDLQTIMDEHLTNMGWTLDASIPTKEKLVELGLEDVAEVLWN